MIPRNSHQKTKNRNWPPKTVPKTSACFLMLIELTDSAHSRRVLVQISRHISYAEVSVATHCLVRHSHQKQLSIELPWSFGKVGRKCRTCLQIGGIGVAPAPVQIYANKTWGIRIRGLGPRGAQTKPSGPRVFMIALTFPKN